MGVSFITNLKEELVKLNVKAISMWRVSNAIQSVILLAIVAVCRFTFIRVEFFDYIRVYIDILIALFVGWLILEVVLLPKIQYARNGYAISTDRVLIKNGIFLFKISNIPVVRIQHVSLSQGPISRLYKLAKVTIHTASGSFTIEGLEFDVANEISEHLKTKLTDRLNSK